MKVTSTYKKHNELYPNKPAIITEQKHLTYGEWYESVQRTAAAFSMEAGTTRRVALFLPNDDVFLQVFAGACEAGWASIIGDMRWKKREIEARLKQTRAPSATIPVWTTTMAELGARGLAMTSSMWPQSAVG